MRQVPSCLNRRYQALDDLIRELSTMSNGSTRSGCATADPGIKLMCDFWNILKEDPNCKLSEHVHRCICPPSEKPSRSAIPTQRITCFMANENTNAPTGSAHSRPAAQGCNAPPLSQVLSNLKEAVTNDKDCNHKLKELLAAEKHLRSQISHLENREKEGIQLLKEADEMWYSMEESYKDKIAQSLERQRDLVKELQEVEKSAAKWRKNKKDLESQLDSIGKCQNEITAKINQKTNDIKSISAEIEAFKKRTDNSKKETEAAKKSLGTKKQASDAKLAKIAQEIAKLEKEIQEENRIKKQKEKEGNGYIKEARNDLQTMCKVLLQKKLETEDLKAEKNSLIQEINLLKDNCNSCKEKCKNKQLSIYEEIKKVDTEIQNFKLRCIRCTQCVDTSEARLFCIDCPRCLQRRECLIQGDSCSPNATEECVCQQVKQRLLDNVFENMYTVLEKKIQTKAGQALANEIVNCLKKSRNGKLNEHTRGILQEFILTTVKKNLNLTIVGGAVKTRCEMDADTYKQLLVCLKQVKPKAVPKSDKGTDVKKDPCVRWGGPSECNCPRGPKDCVCTKRAPPKPSDPTPCPPPDKEDEGEVVKCPHKNEPCGPDCGAHTPNRVGADVSKWRPDPCSGPSCPFGKNMRAAQCVLGLESLQSLAKPGLPQIPGISLVEDQNECKCGASPLKPCDCPRDKRTIPRQQIIEEVMGIRGYVDVKPIDRVATDPYERRISEREGTVNPDILYSNLYSKSIFINDIEVNNRSVQYTLEDLSLKDEFRLKEIKDRFLDEEEKILFFSGSIQDSSSREIISQIFNDGISSAINTKPVRNIKLITNSKSKLETTAELLELSSSSSETCIDNDQLPSPNKESLNMLMEKRHTLRVHSYKNNKIHVITDKSKKVEEIFKLYKKKPKEQVRLISDILNKNVKQLKAGVDKDCSKCVKHQLKDKSTEQIINVDKNVLINKTSPISRKLSKEEIETPYLDFDESEKTEILKTVYDLNQDDYIDIDVGTDPYVKYDAKTEMKVEVDSIDMQTKMADDMDYKTKLINTKSGILAIELPEEIINRLYETIKRSQMPFVYLKETPSGHCNISFMENKKDENYLTFEILESTTGDLELQLLRSEPFSLGLDTLTSGMESVLIQVIKSKDTEKVQTEKDILLSEEKSYEDISKIIEETIFRNEKEIKKKHACSDRRRTESLRKVKKYKRELLYLYDNLDTPKVLINIDGQNGITACIEADIIQTSSKNMALNLKEINKVGQLSAQLQEFPVELSKSPSGTYSAHICCQKNDVDAVPNTILRKTMSDNILLVVTEPPKQFTPIQGIDPKPKSKTPNLNKVKIKGITDKIQEIPTLLRTSPSMNYVCVLDKEFEKQHLECLKSCLDSDENIFPVEICKTDSGITINFDETNSQAHNAVIIKTESNEIKMLVNGPLYDDLVHKQERRSSKQLVQEILLKVPDSDNGANKPIIIKNVPPFSTSKTNSVVKSNSETALYEKGKINNNTLKNSIVKLTKISSGQYTAVLDKESKKSFINEMKMVLEKRPLGLIPVTKTDSGEITITLNANEDAHTEYGALKISPSGNIFIIIDEKAAIGLENNIDYFSKKSDKTSNDKSYNNKSVGSTLSDSGSPHFIKKIKFPLDKMTNTPCNVKYETCVCEPLKCICDHEPLKKCNLKEKFAQNNLPCRIRLNKKQDLVCGKNEICDSDKCSATCCSNINREKFRAPQIKPCSCSIDQKDDRHIEQCFNFSGSVRCLFSNLHSSVSKQILSATKLCNKILSDTSNDRISVPNDMLLSEISSSSYEYNTLQYLPIY